MCGESRLMDTVIDCLMDSWGALWLWVFAMAQDIFILQLTQSWLLTWITSFHACKYHSLNKYVIRNKPVAGREEKADAQCCVFWRRNRVYRQRVCPWSVLRLDKRSLLLQDLVLRKIQEAERSLKINLHKSKEALYILQWGNHCVGCLTYSTFLSSRLQAEFSCYNKEGPWWRKRVSARIIILIVIIIKSYDS